MKKIALFINSLQKGGSERVIVNLAEYFHGKGYEVLLVTQYKREVEYDINPAIKRVYSEPDKSQLGGGRVHNFIVRFKTLRNIWKKFEPDVILSFLGKNNMMAILTSRGLSAKVAVSVRGLPTLEYEGSKQQKLAKFLFGYADGVVLQTVDAMNFFPAKVRKKSVILSNPLNPAFINKRYTGERSDYIVAVGRLDDNKNHAMLIKGFSRIAADFPGVSLRIYGEGRSREDLEQLISEKKLEDRVLLPGYANDVPGTICDARCFVLSSNTEGMPNSIMEAMALGIPVISTDCPCGGPATLIKDGINGLLVGVNDDKALAEALRKMLSDKEFANTISDNAYEFIEELHPDKVNAKWEEYLSSL